MGARNNCFESSTRLLTALALLLIPVVHGLNVGLIAGDLKRHSSPLLIKKISKHSPIFIKINSGLSKSKTPLPLPKLLPKPPLKLLEPKPSKKLPGSLPPLLLPPILPPLLPFLPILPPILPPFLPLLPILPPLLPKLKTPLKPLRVPILKRSTLTPLMSDIKIPPFKVDKKDGILKKLLDLKKKGSLTTAEYIRFKKLLLK